MSTARRTLIDAVDECFPRDGSVLADDWQPDESDTYCPRCGATVGPGSALAAGCSFCRKQRLPWQRLVRLGPYYSPLDDVIRAAKFHGRWTLAHRLGLELAERIGRPFEHDRVAVCPVPMHWLRRWRRGYNQAALIGRCIVSHRRWQFLDVLRRVRHTPPQTALPPSLRQTNVRGAFAIEPVDMAGWEVVLVDDVKTTGATLAGCARLLRQAGARSITVAVVAVADPARQDFQVSSKPTS